jgi:hypothetical protein
VSKSADNNLIDKKFKILISGIYYC